MNSNGRPRHQIGVDSVLNAYGEYHSVRAAARKLNITPGTAWARLKEAGVTPLGMTPREAGQLGAKCKMIEKAKNDNDYQSKGLGIDKHSLEKVIISGN